jgi:predicted DsbA family dithiol-disulfide isomerase
MDPTVGTGHQAGIEFKPHGRIYDSLPGHRLSAWALRTAGPVVQNSLMETLFKLCHENHANFSSIEVLAEAAASVGLDRVCLLVLSCGVCVS